MCASWRMMRPGVVKVSYTFHRGAGAADVREVEAGGGLTFGDVSGAVDTYEGERDAAQVGALQRG